jgi:hypothetical protein
MREAQVAERFAYRAYEEGHPPVLWCIRLDPRGAANVVYRPKQVPSTHYLVLFMSRSPISIFTFPSPPLGQASGKAEAVALE